MKFVQPHWTLIWWHVYNWFSVVLCSALHMSLSRELVMDLFCMCQVRSLHESEVGPTQDFILQFHDLSLHRHSLPPLRSHLMEIFLLQDSSCETFAIYLLCSSRWTPILKPGFMDSPKQNRKFFSLSWSKVWCYQLSSCVSFYNSSASQSPHPLDKLEALWPGPGPMLPTRFGDSSSLSEL